MLLVAVSVSAVRTLKSGPQVLLDVPMPQMVDQTVDIKKIIAQLSISTCPRSSRTAPRSWHMAVMRLAFVGAGSTAMGRFTGGCRAPGATVDVPVKMHDKCQQSLPVDREVLQFHFFDRVLDGPVVPQRQVRPELFSTRGARQACALLGSTVDT